MKYLFFSIAFLHELRIVPYVSHPARQHCMYYRQKKSSDVISFIS